MGVFAVAGQAGLVLAAGLGDVHVHPQAVVPGVVRHPPPQLVVGGVLPVDGGVGQDLAVVVAVPGLGQLPLHPAVVVGVGVKIIGELHAPYRQVGADPLSATDWAMAGEWPYMSAMQVTPEAIISARPRSVQARMARSSQRASTGKI